MGDKEGEEEEMREGESRSWGDYVLTYKHSLCVFFKQRETAMLRKEGLSQYLKF